MKKEISRKILSYFLSFAVAMCLLAAGMLGAFGLAFSEPFLAFVMKSDAYIEKAEKEIIFELESYALPGGLPTDFFKDGLNKETLKKNIDVAIECATAHEPFKSVIFKDEVREQIYAFAESANMDIEQDDIKNNIEKML